MFVVLLKMKKVLIWLICNHKTISEGQKILQVQSQKKHADISAEQLFILLIFQYNIVYIVMVGHKI